MKQLKSASWFLFAFQLLVNLAHVSIHHFAHDLLWTKTASPSLLSELLIFSGGLACIGVVGVVGSQLQRKQKSEDSNPPDLGGGKSASVLLIVVSFVAEGMTQYLVQ